MTTEPDRPLREREESLCPCKSRLIYADCCMPFHYGRRQPATAEELMRARYSAYFFRRVEYLVDTTHPDTRGSDLKRDLEDMIYAVNWSYLTVEATAKGEAADSKGKVEFRAEYFVDEEKHELHEVSRFKRHKGNWKYLDAEG